MKKRLCLLLAAVCMATLSGCGDLPAPSDPVTEPDTTTTQAEEETPQQTRRFALAYSHDDTLDPFSAKTEVNCQLTSLLYEGLTVLDGAMTPQPLLAASVEQTDPTHLTVTLRSDAVFSDGSAVTPADVTASFAAAKKSARYRVLLQNVTAARGEKEGIRFTLAAADPNAAACLTFPIVKAGTLTEEPARGPIGSGVYKIKATDTGAALTRNKRNQTKPTYTTVTLRHLPNTAARQYALASGDITYYFDDLSEGNNPRITGASRPVEMNALLYLGVNGTRGKTADPTVRRALSALMDRTAVATEVYAGRATATVQPFHPSWGAMKGLTVPAKRDLDGAITLLDEAGCKAEGGPRLELELIYSTQRTDRARVADLVRTQLEGGGVAVTLTPLTEEEMRDRLKRGQYDLYLGEIRLTADHSLRPLLRGGDASFGISQKGKAAASYRAYLGGTATLEDFLTVFGEEMPYLPLCWRNGLAAYHRGLTTVTPSAYDPYGGLAEWK